MDSCGLHEHQTSRRCCGCARWIPVCCGRVWWDVTIKYRYDPHSWEQCKHWAVGYLKLQPVILFLFWLVLVCVSLLSGALQSPREPLAHRLPNGDQEEAPRLCRLPGYDLLCWRKRWHHRAEQCWAIQPQNQSVVSCSGHDVQAERGECVLGILCVSSVVCVFVIEQVLL